jgi:phosphatidylglycerophosphate synthase
MIGGLVKNFGDRFFSPVNARAARSGITKPQINALEFAAGCASGIAYAVAFIPAGWVLLLIHGFLDYFDGGTRRTGMRSTADHTILGLDTHVLVDKGSEAVLFTGMAVGTIVPPWVAILALASSLAVTVIGQYLQKTRDYSPEHTIFDRADRILCILVIGVAVNYSAALILVCGMNGIIITQRIAAPFFGRRSVPATGPTPSPEKKEG